MRRLLVCGALSLLAGCHRHHGGEVQHGGGGSGAAVTPHSDQEKTLYALGAMMGQRVGEFSLSNDDLAFVQQGLRDSVTGAHPQVDVQQYSRRLADLAHARQAAHAEVEHTQGTAFAEAAAHEPGAQRTSSGLVYRELRAGTGPQPAGSDTVRVNYRGTLRNGTVFDSSYDRGQPAQFALGGVIPCWTEGLQRMHVGGQARLVCPSSIAYGDRGQRNIPAGATLIFEVELMAIVPAAPPTGGLNGAPGPGPASQPPMPPGLRSGLQGPPGMSTVGGMPPFHPGGPGGPGQPGGGMPFHPNMTNPSQPGASPGAPAPH